MTDAAQRAREAAMGFEVKKDRLAQCQDGTWKLTLTVAPGDMPTAILTAAMGTRYQIAMVQIGDDEEPVPPQAPAPREAPPAPAGNVTPLRRHPGGPLSRQAAMICGEGAFRRFLAEVYGYGGLQTAEHAAMAVRQITGVDGRAEFDANPERAARWKALHDDYRIWMRS